MTEIPTFTEAIAGLYPGAIVDANSEIAVIVDVLVSQHTDNVCLYVRFPRNIGNSRSYDVLALSPSRTLGVETWTLTTREQLEAQLKARRDWLEGELDQLRALVRRSTAMD